MKTPQDYGAVRTRESEVRVVAAAVRRALRKRVRGARGALAVVALGATSAASAGPFPAEIDLATLLPANGGDGSAGFALVGVDADTRAGDSLSDAGDVNGDGLDDFIIGAPGTNQEDVPGSSFVVFGRTEGFPAKLELANLLAANGGDGSKGFVVVGFHESDNLGTSVSDAGDFNGDGIDDLIVGAPALFGTDPQSFGQAYVVFGRDVANAGDFPAELDVASLLPQNGGDGSAGVVLDRPPPSDMGSSVSAAGDVNGDGIGDIVVGDERDGLICVVFGRDAAQPGTFPALIDLSELLPGQGGDGSDGFVMTNDVHDPGVWVSGAGDVNADGIADIVIGEPTASCFNGASGCGRAFLVFGRDAVSAGGFPAVLELEDLLPENGGDGSAGVAMDGFGASSALGRSVASAGDVNGDGIDDAIIGTYNGAGRSYVVFGRNVVEDGNFPPYLALPSLLPPAGDGSAGFVVSGFQDFEEAGGFVDGADINHDGIDDLIIGTDASLFTIGRGYVVYGRDTAQSGNFPARFELASLLPVNGGDGSAGFVMNGIQAGDYAGSAVSRAGDVNGDGVGDLLIGAPSTDMPGRESAGTTFVVYGRSGTLDSDADGVADDVDACPATAIPESVPRVRLAPNRFALVDDDTTFDRGTPGGPAPSPFTTTDTRGCSCDQILTQLGHGGNERALGCKAATMQEWIQQDQSRASR